MTQTHLQCYDLVSSLLENPWRPLQSQDSLESQQQMQSKPSTFQVHQDVGSYLDELQGYSWPLLQLVSPFHDLGTWRSEVLSLQLARFVSDNNASNVAKSDESLSFTNASKSCTDPIR